MFKSEFGGDVDIIDRIKIIYDKYDMISRNYERERNSIVLRLKNSSLSTGKREKLIFRLNDLDQRLIPEVQDKLSQIQPPAII